MVRIKPHTFVITCLLVILAYVFPLTENPGLASAEIRDQQVSKSCRGLDIVFVVSYSYSMGHLNDNIGLRQKALQAAIQILGDNTLYLCRDYQHRLAIVGFGDRKGGTDDVSEDTRDFINPTTISPKLQTISDWTEQKYKLANQIPENYDIGDFKSSGYTNFKAGLERAAQILSQWRDTSLGGGARQQAVVVISDGAMCTERYGCDFKKVISTIEPIVDKDSKFLPSNVSIDHIGFYCEKTICKGTPFFDLPDIKEFWTRVTKEHGGQLAILQHGTTEEERKFAHLDLDAKVASVLGNHLGSTLGIASCDSAKGIEPIWVEPYKNNFLILYVYRYKALEKYSLIDVDVSIEIRVGNNVIAEIKNGIVVSGDIKFAHSKAGTTERYIFYLPPPGKYVIKVDKADPCQGVAVQSGTLGVLAHLREPGPNAQLLNIDQEPYFDRKDPQKFKFQLVQLSENGQEYPLQEMADYPLQIEVQVSGKEDVAVSVNETYKLSRTSKQDSIWEADLPISRRYPGHYLWEIIARSTNPRANDPTAPITTPVEVLKTNGGFEILHVERKFDYILSSQSPDTVYLNEKNASTPLEVLVQVVGEDGKTPLRRDLRIADAVAKPFSATLALKTESGSGATETQPMVWQEGNLYYARFGSTGFKVGCYQLTVSLTTDYYSRYFIPLKREPLRQEICFKKTEFNYRLVSAGTVTGPSSQAGSVGPLKLAIQLTDPQGNPLDDNVVISGQPTDPFTATLKPRTEMGDVLDTKPMQRQPGNKYEVVLGDVSLKPVCYQLEIELRAGKYREDRYKPISSDPIKQQLCWFKWEVKSPSSNGQYTLHPILGLFPHTQSVPLEIQVISSDSNKPISALSVTNKDNKIPAFKGELVTPVESQPYKLDFYSDEKSGLFTAQWPDRAIQAGSYTLTIQMVPDGISPLWLPVAGETIRVITFQRGDTLLSNPWSLIAAIVLSVNVIALVGLLILCNGPLANSVVTFNNQSEISTEISTTQISNKGKINRWVLLANKKQCDEQSPGQGLRYVTIENCKRVKDDDGSDMHQADLTVVYDDGDVHEPKGLKEREPFVTKPNQELFWENRPSLFLSRSWHVLLGELAFIVMYFFVFYILFTSV